MKDVSIIIVNHNTKNLCTQAISSIENSQEKINYEIIVVDNSNRIEERYEGGILIKNKGFGNACNIGAKAASGKYLLFLNPDTILHKETLTKTMTYLERHKKIGVLGIKALLEDGTIDHACKRGFPTPINSLFYFIGLDRIFPKSKFFCGYSLSYLSPEEIHVVDSVSGAFMMIPKWLFEKVGAFDEDYFIHCEDIDLCYRINKMGMKVVYYGKASMLHYKTGIHLSNNKTLINSFYESMQIFYDKHYHGRYHWFINAIVKWGIKMKKNNALRKING